MTFFASLFSLILLTVSAVAAETPKAAPIAGASAAIEREVSFSTTAVLAKVKDYDRDIERATLHFSEEFFIVATRESERLTGRVYFDRKNNRLRADYSGKIKYKVWIDSGTVHLYDESLKQVVIRSFDEFGELHLQAFLDLPVFFDMGKFEDRYTFSIVKSSTVAASGVVYLRRTAYGIRSVCSGFNPVCKGALR